LRPFYDIIVGFKQLVVKPSMTLLSASPTLLDRIFPIAAGNLPAGLHCFLKRYLYWSRKPFSVRKSTGLTEAKPT